MGATLDRLASRLHLAAALLSAWLILTSPWIAMLRAVPRSAGVLDYSHIVLGFAALLVAIAYTISCTSGGSWRLYFPWAAGKFQALGRDISGLLRGHVPASEVGGLFAVIEGFLLVLLLATAITGAAWFFTQGTGDALAWRGYHILAARWLAGFIVVHVVTVSLHLFDLVRE
ncbi:MAG: cytochrome b/b6 domain-containing protein [Steroidobacteraceae bacterium]